MSTPRRPQGDTLNSGSSSTYSPNRNDDAYSSYLAGNEPRPTVASFSPATLSSSQPISAAKRLSTILVHQKSPLLLATPPQVTRALAYSHPFLLPLNKFVALLSWTTGDSWESFLLVAVFWATVLYGGVAVRLAGPLVLILFLILGMYARRFSPLSSSGWSEDGGAGGGSVPNRAASGGKGKNKASSSTSAETLGATAAASATAKASAASASGAAQKQHTRTGSNVEATNTKHQKTLDEIVETLKDLTARCNILMEPLLELTDFLSTQRTATSATTRPALTTLFVRIMLCTPLWVALTLPPFRLITTRRVALVVGTIILTWHARVVKAGRTLLWRSASVRRLAALLTGLEIPIPDKAARGKGKGRDPLGKAREVGSSDKPASSIASVQTQSELTRAVRRARGATDAGVRFTFIIYENQRRWVGLGWTSSLFSYERAAWTDEHNNPVPPKDKFELPEVENDSHMRWGWVDKSIWRVDGVPDEAVSGGGANGKEGEWNYDGEGGKNGWVYYDNKDHKWQSGRRGQDGWGRWTRRRKWYRDAELVEIDSDDDDNEAGSEAEKEASEDTTPTPGSKARPAPAPAPALPPRPRTPTLAPPLTTTSETASMPDLLRRRDDPLDDIREEARTGRGDAAAVASSERDDNSSVLSTSSRSTRFKMPSLRRRVTDNNNSNSNNNGGGGGGGSKYRYDDVMSSPRSIAVSAYSVGSTANGRSRRTSEVQSEDDTASLGPVTGLQISKDRGDSWGVGDEVVMGLE